ncbi:MAG: hypothetical protein EZS28_036417 [Streblomastix strix]|uniref:Uncharacterized protein n=1 Tax=Streblomastix strix TaxID=222440 RepID=A0A5J4UC11_9EUKA|nr:MAG: hypothetical protein EZS28_036417 [Streblomastix strix]
MRKGQHSKIQFQRGLLLFWSAMLGIIFVVVLIVGIVCIFKIKSLSQIAIVVAILGGMGVFVSIVGFLTQTSRDLTQTRKVCSAHIIY